MPPPPPVLAPAHDIQNIMATKIIAAPVFFRPLPVLILPEAITSAGKRHIDKSNAARLLADDPLLVEIFSTTSTAEFPGVTGPEGLKMHCACAGNPAEQARLTAPAKDDPTGWTLKAYGPEVCPACTV